MLMLFLEAAGNIHGPCGRPGARGHHVGDPWLSLYITQHFQQFSKLIMLLHRRDSLHLV